MNLEIKLAKAIGDSKNVIDQLVNSVNEADISLQEAEQRIQTHLQQIGRLMMDNVISHIKKPDLILENSIIIGDQEFRYNGNKYTRMFTPKLKAEKAS